MVVCTLVLGVWADSFDDVWSGEWKTAALWSNTGGGGDLYPWDDDTTLIDSHEIYCQWDTQLPATADVTISGAGVLKLESSQVAKFTLGAGGTLWLASTDAIHWASAFAVAVTGEANLKSTNSKADYWSPRIHKELVGASKLNVIGGGIALNSANPSFSGGFDIQSNAGLVLFQDGASGTGPVTVRSGGALTVWSDQAGAVKPSLTTLESGAELIMYTGYILDSTDSCRVLVPWFFRPEGAMEW